MTKHIPLNSQYQLAHLERIGDVIFNQVYQQVSSPTWQEMSKGHYSEFYNMFSEGIRRELQVGLLKVSG